MNFTSFCPSWERLQEFNKASEERGDDILFYSLKKNLCGTIQTSHSLNTDRTGLKIITREK